MRHKRSVAFVTAVLALAGCVVEPAPPPTLEEVAASTDIIAEATVAGRVNNPNTDSPTVQFMDVHVIWSGEKRTMFDGTVVEIPMPPDPLTAWAQWQEIDRIAEGTKLLVGLGFSPRNPYGEWVVTLALDVDLVGLAVGSDQLAGNALSLDRLSADLDMLFSAAGSSRDARLSSLGDLIIQQREALFERNLSSMPQGS